MEESSEKRIPPEMERYIALCKRAYDRMMQTGEWPWEDKPNFDETETANSSTSAKGS